MEALKKGYGTMKENPFTISFGKKPRCYISRTVETNEVITNFESTFPPTQVYMITGVRGSGKTVMMTELSDYFEQNGWISLDISPDEDIVASIIANLYNEKGIKSLFTKAEIAVSALGISASVYREQPAAANDVVLKQMLEILKKNNKKLLITIDEVTNNKNIKRFSSLFQSFIRKDYPIFLIMTGLYDNIYKLQNNKDLTFLYRAPKIAMKPLDEILISETYRKIFAISDESVEMSKYTKGYSYAFQMLGYLRWNNQDKKLSEILPEYDYILKEYSYNKIWSELSAKDKEIMREISKYDVASVKEIRDSLNISSSLFSSYRERLFNSGLIDISEYGKVASVLPRFREFVEGK